MKKLLFVLAFTFIGGQAFSQMYIATILDQYYLPSAGCINAEHILVKVNPSGVQTTTCIPETVQDGGLITLNQELNSIISMGYKLMQTLPGGNLGGQSSVGGYISDSGYLRPGTTFIFAIPWSASGLEEVATTLKSFLISPNPANTFVDISLDYSLKGESEVIFISEAGYISHKQSLGEILKNEKYNIDISKIPAGKYLVTIVNGKTYTTPQKLIVF